MSLINIEKTIALDVYDHNTTPSVIKTIQMDTGTRTVFAMIQNSGQAYDIGQNATVSLTVLRPDKTKVQITGQTFSYTGYGSDATAYGARADLSDIALAAKGNLKAQFKITSGAQELRTEIFTINNGEALDAGDGDWAGDLDGHNLDEMAQDIEDVKAAVSEMESDVSDLKEGLSELESSVATPITEKLTYTPIQRKLLTSLGVTDIASDLYYVSSSIAVTAGETLTITGSANYYNYLWCFFDSSDTIVEYEGAGGSGSVIVQRTKTVTVPNNAVSVRVAYISPRSGAVQRQIGIENNLLGRVEAIEKQMPASDGKVKLTKTGNSLAVTDITTGAYLTADTAGSQNGTLNFEKYWNSLGQAIKDASDDICPIYYDQSHRCGNHGNYVVYQVLSANHGLTESDIGKAYTSANGISYVLVKVPDANTLWFVNDTANIVSGTPIFNVTVPESPMSGDSVVSFTTATRSQLVPSVNHIVQAIDVDGVPVSTDGEYEGDEVTIFEAYNSINTYAMLAVLKANIGNNTNVSYYAENLSADLVYATTYSIGAGLKMVVSSKIVILREAVNLTSWGVVQSQQIGHRLYVPYSTDTGVVTTTGIKTYTSAEWADADFPPSKMYQFHTTDDSKGFLVAYNLDYANGIPATRKPLILSSAVTQSTAYKLYPYILSINTDNHLAVGTELSGVALRQLIPLNDTLVSTYDFGGNGYAEIDHLTEGEAIVTISAKYNGKRVEVLHKSSGIAILATTISGSQLAIYGKGSLSLKLV